MIGDGFRWLVERAHFPVGFCATFARGMSPEELLDRLGCDPEHTAVRIAMDAEDLRDDLTADDEETIVAVVRSGSRAGWAFGLEDVTLYAADPRVLSRVSVGTEVASLRRDAAHGEVWFELWRDGRPVEHRVVRDPDELTDLEDELGIDAPVLELLSPTVELLTGFARWDD
ncbi:DUF6461 domain-containing protein [Streptomyces sp. SID3343]|uniref:DUF6461 domain-containing protein n=1 Tax=Streptomyces sp. SID3343 TaxID=2690260 RepID=UPI00136F4844|nr:DUF6461 domain-containing protein [Streptomyces sp. SID3343]MYW00934.1 hypothetical protein [Streptomyces sp. SID3343]